MKRRRFQRQNRRLLVILGLLFLTLAVSAYVYISLRGELLLRDFKIFVEKALSQMFGGGKVSIGDVKGGVFYPITFSDVILYGPPKGEHKLLEAKHVSINYNLWDLFLNQRKHIFKMKLIAPQFFIVPKRYYEEVGGKKGSFSFPAPYIQLDIIDGSIISYDTKKSVVKEVYGKVELNGKIADLKNMAFNLYELPVRVNGRISNLYTDSPHLDIDMALQGDYFRVTTHLEGPFERLSAKGGFEVVDGIKTDFAGLCKFYKSGVSLEDTILGSALKVEEGYIDLVEKNFNLKLLSQVNNSGQIIIDGNFGGHNISLSGDIKHWPVGGLDVVTKMSLEVGFKQKVKTPVVTGAFNTTNTIINYKPCEELSLQFTLRRKAVEILGLKWGKSFRLVGKLELNPPYNIEAISLLDGTRLEELASFGGENLQNIVAGRIKGRLEVEGPLINCVSRGHITSRNGRIGNIYYENAVIHLVGKGPLITIGDSRIYKEIGHFILSGEIDLRKLGKRNIFEDVVVKSDDQTIVWEGWDITREATTEKVSLKKRISEELEVGFKAPLDNGGILEQNDREGEVELKYKIREHESLKIRLREEEEFLGVEHKIKF